MAAPTPPVGLSPQQLGAMVPPGAPAAAPQPAAPTTITCTNCGSSNESRLRFCMTCGSRLPGPGTPAPGPVAAVGPQPPAPQQQPPQQQQPPIAAQQPIAPQPILGAGGPPPQDLAPTPFTGSPSAPPVVCGRCHGNNDPGSTFCRFCGAQLSARAPQAQPAPEPPRAPHAQPEPPRPAAAPNHTQHPDTRQSAGNDAVTAAPPRPPTVPPPVPRRSSAPPPPRIEAPRIEPAKPAEPPPPPAAPSLVEPVAAKNDAPPASSAPATEAIPSRPQPKPAEARGRVVVVAKDGTESASFPLQERVDVGRYEGELRFPEDPYLSARHLRIYEKDGTYYVKDLGTLNGTFLRLRDGESVPIEAGALFLVGQQLLRLVAIPHEEEIPAAAREHGVLLFGTPPFPRYARLEQRSVEGTTLDVYHLHKTETVLGRESGDVVFSDDAFLSRRHAAVRIDQATRKFELVDLHSSNGSFARLGGEVELRHRDQVRVGQQLLRIELNDKSGKGGDGPRSKG